MEIFLATFLIMLTAIGGMAVGVIFKRHPIKGSCGGLNKIDGVECLAGCSKPCEKRRQASRHVAKTS